MVLLLPAGLAFGDTHYVSLSGSHTPPFTNWPTAATDIQAAIDVAVDGDIVLVTNGVYDTGGVVIHEAIKNRIAITNAITVSSVNGPDLTFIVGNGPMGDAAVRCAYVGDDARLQDFTLTGGHTRTNGDNYTEQRGGGAWCEDSGVVSNCNILGNIAKIAGGGTSGGIVQRSTISANSADNGGGTGHSFAQNCSIFGNSATDVGGGALGRTVRDCTLFENSAGRYGGGAAHARLQNCTIVGNLANSGGGGGSSRGGGAYESILQNCIVYYNSALLWGLTHVSNYRACTIEYTCTTPAPSGIGNITNEPQFVDAAISNFHLLSTSPCIDNGTNEAWMIGATDLDGIQRIVNATVDMGAYESLSPAITDIAPSSNGLVITWHSVSNVDYSVVGASNLVTGFDTLLQDQIPATPPFNAYTATVDGVEHLSYGVEVEP